ncbi:MAG: 1-(5-phosphoribosyl)-5-[(5-phosphoribosylamino)methylideneamino]imidazole-4-carboxamide isomerase [Candidatus Latescibacter sp.]|nr:1-(5-phosphoribosyl)-5-[(5-phosphoribosylamino)methylideneamino]imidazole-4-carboxamide isomerase [Candidatus Latescibacter sp.]
MIVIPAVDIKDGKCVRLLQGRMEDAKVYSDTPLKMALRWEKEGGKILHIVDLNGAFEGFGVNDSVVQEILEHVHVPVELGGGIRDMARIDTLLTMGIKRVILGTAAVENPRLVSMALDKYGPERILVGIDAKNGMAATRGWASDGGRPAVELGLEMKALGIERIVYTDISRDGMLTGPNIAETGRMARETGLKVIASGGVSSLDDIRALQLIESSGVDSVIVGKALYEGKFGLREAIEVAG